LEQKDVAVASDGTTSTDSVKKLRTQIAARNLLQGAEDDDWMDEDEDEDEDDEDEDEMSLIEGGHGKHKSGGAFSGGPCGGILEIICRRRTPMPTLFPTPQPTTVNGWGGDHRAEMAYFEEQKNQEYDSFEKYLKLESDALKDKIHTSTVEKLSAYDPLFHRLDDMHLDNNNELKISEAERKALDGQLDDVSQAAAIAKDLVMDYNYGVEEHVAKNVVALKPGPLKKLDNLKPIVVKATAVGKKNMQATMATFLSEEKQVYDTIDSYANQAQMYTEHDHEDMDQLDRQRSEMLQVVAKTHELMMQTMALQNNIFSVSNKASDDVQSMVSERMTLTNQLRADISKKLVGVLGKIDATVKEKGTTIRGRWKTITKDADEELVTVEKNLDNYFSEFSKEGLGAFSQLQGLVETGESDLEAGEEEVVTAKNDQRMASGAFKQGARGFSIDADNIEKKLFRTTRDILKVTSDKNKEMQADIKAKEESSLVKARAAGMSMTMKTQGEIRNEVAELSDDGVAVKQEMENDMRKEADRAKRLKPIPKAIEMQVGALGSAISSRSSEINTGFDKLRQMVNNNDELISGSITKESGLVSKAEAPLADASYNLLEHSVREIDSMTKSTQKDVDSLKIPLADFDERNSKLKQAMKDSKKYLGEKVGKGMQSMQQNVEWTGQVINEDVPNAKEHALKKLTAVMDALQGTEDKLKLTSKADITRAMSLETLGSIQTMKESKEAGTTLSNSLRRADLENVRDFGLTEKDIAKRKDTALSDVEKVSDINKETIDAATLFAQEIASDSDKVVGGAITKINKDTSKSLELGEASFHTELQNVDRAVEDQIATRRAAVAENEKRVQATQKYSVTAEAKLTATTASQANDDASETVSETGEILSANLEDAKEALRTLTAHAQGNSANEEEWGNNLEKSISGSKALMHQQKMLNAKNNVERQAAIDARFQDIYDVAQQDVAGLDTEKQQYIHKLTQKAKQESERILASEALSDEEKTARLAEMNAWLVGNLKEVTQTTEDGRETFGEANVEDADFAKMADEKFTTLDSRLNFDDAAKGVDLNRKKTEGTAATLANLLATAEQEVTDISKEALANVSSFDQMHELDAKSARAAMSLAVQGLDAGAKEADEKADDSLNFLKEEVGRQSQELKSTDTAMNAYGQGMDTRLGTFEKRVKGMENDRTKRLGQIGDARDALQVAAGLGAEALGSNLNLLMDEAGKHLNLRSEQQSEFTEKLEKVMNSDTMKILLELKDADNVADDIKEKDSEMLENMAASKNNTFKWQAMVAHELSNLGGELKGELAQMAEHGKKFKQEIMSAMGDASGDAKAAGMKALDDEAANIKRVEDATAQDGDRFVDALNAKKKLGAAADDAAEDGMNAQERAAQLNSLSMMAKSNKANAQIAEAEKAAALAKAKADKLAADKRNAADSKRSGVNDKLKILMKTSLAQVEDPSNKIASALEHNQELSDRHQHLVSEIKNLESIAHATQIIN